MSSTKPFHLLIKEIEKASFIEFSRSPKFTSEGISCDCAGLITILLKDQKLSPKGLEDTPKVKDYYSWIVNQELQKNTIQELDRHDVLLWKKNNPPKSGDTGHILLLLNRPKKIAEDLYELCILEVNRFNGLCKRNINITTFKDGRLKGIAWHPEKSKIKETVLIGADLFKRPNCDICHSIRELCQCELMPLSRPKAPPIIIFRHPSEKGHPLGTVGILQQFFSDLIVEEGEVFKERKGTLLYPQGNDENHLCAPDKVSHKAPLILIDGTWKKAYKIIKKNPWLLNLPRLSLTTHESQYFLRKQKSPYHLSSLESFCYSLEQISKDDSKSIAHSESLLKIFRDFIEKRKAFYGEEVIQEYFGDRS